ncbi:MAG: hypothetical protein Q9216_007070 [Gyalolechia sp. 2 TL-2023]
MANYKIICTGISSDGQPIGKFADGLFPCHYCVLSDPERPYASQVVEKGQQWVHGHCPLQDFMNLAPHGRLVLFQNCFKAVTPEFINVIDREGFWRLPYSPRPGEHRNVTEGVATLMAYLDGRFTCFGFGAEENRGDIFMSGSLSQTELFDLERGHFPPTLAMYGSPGPGVCGRPAERRMVSHPPLAGPYDAYQSRGPGSSRQLGAPPRLVGAPPPHAPQRNPRRSNAPRRFYSSRSEAIAGSDSDSDSDSTAVASPIRRTKPRTKAAKGKPKAKPKSRQRSPSEDEDEDDDLSPSEEEDEPPRRPQKGQATKVKSKPKPSRRQRSPSEEEDDSDELFLSEDEDEPPRRAPRGKAAKEKPKTKPRRRQRSPSEVSDREDELGLGDDDDDDPPACPARSSAQQGRRRGRSPSDDEDVTRARQPAARVPAGRDRRRGRSPEDDGDDGDDGDDELPAMDPEEKMKLDALKVENGYGKGKKG